tara:strand:- start:68 stop:253 length:186 start_codon:yes stop_codon:yes gene_type:complete
MNPIRKPKMYDLYNLYLNKNIIDLIKIVKTNIKSRIEAATANVKEAVSNKLKIPNGIKIIK